MIIPTVIALVLTITMFLLISWVSFKASSSQLKSDLDSKSTSVTRRISAELLIGDRGAPQAVADTLKKELALEEIQVSSSAPCIPTSATEPCSNISNGRYSVSGIATSTSVPVYVTVYQTLPSLNDYLSLSVLLWSSLAVLLTIGLGIYFQQIHLRRYVQRPIESIISKTVSGADIPSHWPQEFVRLQDDLDEAFRKRDQALIGQIASGVIHDLKTLLQPITGAAQLASEQTGQGDKRSDMLLRACLRNLPKMQRILEDVLDGNREIQLQRRNDSLLQTMNAAVLTAKEAADISVPVSVEVDSASEHLMLPHDPIQLERALANLIKNGIEAASLAESNRRVRVSLEQSGPDIVLNVDDSGPGLSAPLDQIIASRRTSKRRGTGLGLLVSKKIIEAHRATLISERSTTLSGARFSILFPGGAT